MVELSGMSEREQLNDLLAKLNDSQIARTRAYVESLLQTNLKPDQTWNFDFASKFAQAEVSAARDRAGMEVQAAEATCEGVKKFSLWEHPPLSGAATISYAVPIPPRLRALKLKFFVGIRDGSQLPMDRYIAYRVMVNGWKLWSAVKNSRAWDEYTVNMPELASDVVRIEFQTDGLGDHRWNWAVWGEPKLIGEM